MTWFDQEKSQRQIAYLQKRLLNSKNGVYVTLQLLMNTTKKQ